MSSMGVVDVGIGSMVMNIGADEARPSKCLLVEFRTESMRNVDGWDGIHDEVMIIAVSCSSSSSSSC